MPELFGNAYILPVVIVVVLLLALLLILMIKRRRGASPRDVKPVERVATPEPRPTPAEVPQKPDTSTAPTDEPARATAQPAVTTQAALAAQPPAPDQPPPVIPVTRVGAPPKQAAPTDDPLKTVIVDIIHGWGELTSEDTNRLDLFRPDKVLAVAETIELPKEDAGGGYARTRLLQIRKYAADKQVKHKPSEQVSPPGSEPVAETEPVSTADLETSRPEVPELDTPGVKGGPPRPMWEPPRPDGAAAGVGLAGAGLAAAGLAAAAGADAEDAEQIEDRESLEKALGDGESEWSAPEPIEPSPRIEESQPEGSAAPSPWPEAPQAAEPRPEEPESGEPGMPSPWSEAPAGWDVQEPAVLEEVPVQLDAVTPLVDTEPVGMVEAVAAVGAVKTGGAEEPLPMEEPPPAEDMTARVQASDDSLSSLHVRVRTADELMALPPQERADMLAFLEPPELARVIETSEDRKLKKSVIDVLENLGNPASLDVLRRCLDDSDPEIQLYALDAADRLLGVE